MKIILCISKKSFGNHDGQYENAQHMYIMMNQDEITTWTKIQNYGGNGSMN